MKQPRAITVILTWEEPLWKLCTQGTVAIEAEAPTIPEVFAGFYNAMTDLSRPAVEFVHTFHQHVPGMYRFEIKELPEGKLAVRSTDILGLNYQGEAEDAMLSLPVRIMALLGAQGAHKSST